MISGKVKFRTFVSKVYMPNEEDYDYVFYVSIYLNLVHC